MRSERISKITHFFKGEKNILWIGSKDERPPQLNRSLLGQIRFLTFDDVDGDIAKITAPIVFLSLTKEEHYKKLSDLFQDDKINIAVIGTQITDKEKNILSQYLNGKSLFRLIEMPADENEIAQIIEEAQTKVKGDRDREQRMDLALSMTAQLELVQNDLKKQAETKSKNLNTSRKEVERESQNMRALVRFVKDVSIVVDVESFLRLLKNEVKQFHHIKDPILGYTNNRNDLRLVYFQGVSILNRPAQEVWPQFSRTRLNDVKDSQYLANSFSRPFARLITIPLSLRRETREESSKTPAIIFFEHDLAPEEIDLFLNYIEERLQPLSVALDRLLLEQDLKDASKLWERTFDGIQDPVAIFDLEGHIIRANRSFSEKFSTVPPQELRGESVRHDERIYEVSSYPITIGRDHRPTHQINHYVDKTHAQKLKKQIVQNEKMAALGHLAGNIAHELNNPLTGVRSLAQVLLGQMDKGTTVYSDLTEVEKAAERCQVIIQNLLDFSAGGVNEKQKVCSLNEIIQRTLPLLKTALSRFHLQTQFVQKDSVYVEPHLLQQVVFNIVKNACQAMNDGGTLTVATDHVMDEQTGRPAVVLSIQDTGAGIPAEILNQIFDFFFTTKSPGQGTGIGLSLSKNIVDRFGGRIHVSSKVGEGTEFQIWLPYVVQEST